MEHAILGAIEDNALEDGEHAVGIVPLPKTFG